MTQLGHLNWAERVNTIKYIASTCPDERRLDRGLAGCSCTIDCGGKRNAG